MEEENTRGNVDCCLMKQITDVTAIPAVGGFDESIAGPRIGNKPLRHAAFARGVQEFFSLKFQPW